MGQLLSANAEDEPQSQDPESAEETTDITGSEPAEDESELQSYVAGLSPDQQHELATLLGGNLGKDLGKLRQENRELRETLETEAAKRGEFKTEKVENNPYESIDSEDQLNETYQNALQTIRNGNRQLRKHRDSLADEPIMTVGDRELTRSEVEDMVANAEDARDLFLPARLKEVQEVQKSKQQNAELEKHREANMEAVHEAHPWLKEEGNDLRAAYEEITPSIIDQVRENLPQLLPTINMVLADHAIMAQQRRTGTKTQPSSKITPSPRVPGSPSANAATSSRPNAGDAKVKAAAEQEFLKSGNAKDFARFLAHRK